MEKTTYERVCGMTEKLFKTTRTISNIQLEEIRNITKNENYYKVTGELKEGYEYDTLFFELLSDRLELQFGEYMNICFKGGKLILTITIPK